jgi:hypothetical protein
VNAFFVDSGLVYKGDPATEIGGLEHLEGKEVAILADGKVHPRRTVAGGKIYLDYPARVVFAGLPYRALGKTMRPEVGTRSGTMQGKVKIVSKVVLRLIQALGGMVGPDLDHLEPLIYREVADEADRPPPLWGVEEAEDLEADFQGYYETTGQVLIVHDEPLPFTVAAVMPRLMAMED